MKLPRQQIPTGNLARLNPQLVTRKRVVPALPGRSERRALVEFALVVLGLAVVAWFWGWR